MPHARSCSTHAKAIFLLVATLAGVPGCALTRMTTDIGRYRARMREPSLVVVGADGSLSMLAKVSYKLSSDKVVVRRRAVHFKPEVFREIPDPPFRHYHTPEGDVVVSLSNLYGRVTEDGLITLSPASPDAPDATVQSLRSPSRSAARYRWPEEATTVQKGRHTVRVVPFMQGSKRYLIRPESFSVFLKQQDTADQIASTVLFFPALAADIVTAPIQVAIFLHIFNEINW